MIVAGEMIAVLLNPIVVVAVVVKVVKKGTSSNLRSKSRCGSKNYSKKR